MSEEKYDTDRMSDAQPVRILLVEDEGSFAALVELRLRAIEGVLCTVELEGTLAGALGRLAREHFDLVIADLHLPDSPGEATIARLVDACDQPIIALTADSDPDVRARALASGAYDFLTKGRPSDRTLERLVRLAALQARTLASLRSSEERFRKLTELSSDWYWETDVEHRLTHTTHDGKFGRIEGHIFGKRRWERPSVEPDAAGWAAHRAVLDAHRPFRDFEIARLDADGVRRDLSISGEPVFGPGGHFIGYRGVGRDTTAQRREQRLVALEHAVTRVVAEAQDVPGALREVMRAVCESEAWEGARFLRLDGAGEPMRCEESWGAGEAPFAFSFPVTFEGRVLGVLAISSRAMRKPDERLTQTMSVIGAQIGQFLQRKQAEAALSESERRFRQTFELAGSGIAHISLAGRFLGANRRLCQILGYAEHELRTLSLKDISHPEDREASDPGRSRMHRGEVDSVRFEKRCLRKDGSVVWVDLTVAAVRSAQGEPQHEIVVMEDITERKEREGALQRFRTALDSAADMVFLFDVTSGRLLDFNETACTYLGYRRDELLGLRGKDIRVGASADTLREETAEMIRAGGRRATVVTQYRRKDGSTFPVESRRSLIDTPQGRVLLINSRDLSERVRAEERRAAQARYQKKIARLGEAALSKRDAAELVAKAVQRVLEGLGAGAVAYFERGPEPGEMVLRHAVGLDGASQASTLRIHPDGPLGAVLERGEPFVLDAASAAASPLPFAPLPFEWARGYASLAVVAVPAEGGARGLVCALAEAPGAFGAEETRFLGAAASMLSAALHRLDSEARLAYLAQYDALTGLPNRALLSDRFGRMIVQARRRGTGLGVLFIDLDDFKMVNDTRGHAAGDELLKEAARRVQSALRDGDTVARISGDEFAVILSDLARADDAAVVAQKILERLIAPVDVGGQEAVVTASIGIATFPADGDDPEALLGAADAAMYRAKQSGRNAFQFFTPDIDQRTRARAMLGTELRRALERKEFQLHYQAKIDLASGRPCGAEALLRWEHPERGRVPPVEFIPVLEETGLIVPVGEWVLRKACEDLKAWQAAGLPAMPVAVNLSARQFRQHDLDERIRAIIAAAGVDPSLLEFEITESQLMHDPEHGIRVLERLAAAGLRIAIDDFGTGYSSLAYLTRFPLASLKIDRSFVADALSDAADGTMVRTIVDMAHTLGFTVVAEGVERDAQAAFLRTLGCEQAQGFFFARPMTARDFGVLLALDGELRLGVRAPVVL
ncbi:MAG TPA: EAL domain-containing protein [Burkholderiales bacterium]|nr:EAL domain-containing protein [Burkholderiales bacterium]